MYFSKNDTRPIGMPKQVFLAYLEPVFGPCILKSYTELLWWSFMEWRRWEVHQRYTYILAFDFGASLGPVDPRTHPKTKKNFL